MSWQTRQQPCLVVTMLPMHRVLILWWLLLMAVYSWAGEGKQMAARGSLPQDPCQTFIWQSTKQLEQILAFRLLRGFPLTAQLDEGNARLLPLSIVSLDCEQQRVIVSGNYEFRGNFGVMDITRRGTTVLQFHLDPKPGQQQIWLKDPEVLHVTFDNPAPWFDGQAISHWARAIFLNPICANLQNGQPC